MSHRLGVGDYFRRHLYVLFLHTSIITHCLSQSRVWVTIYNNNSINNHTVYSVFLNLINWVAVAVRGKKWVLITTTAWSLWRRSVWVPVTSAVSLMANGKLPVLLSPLSTLLPIRFKISQLFYFLFFYSFFEVLLYMDEKNKELLKATLICKLK